MYGQTVDLEDSLTKFLTPAHDQVYLFVFPRMDIMRSSITKYTFAHGVPTLVFAYVQDRKDNFVSIGLSIPNSKGHWVEYWARGERILTLSYGDLKKAGITSIFKLSIWMEDENPDNIDHNEWDCIGAEAIMMDGTIIKDDSALEVLKKAGIIKEVEVPSDQTTEEGVSE